MTSPSAMVSSMASTATRQQIVQITGVDPTTSTAVGQTAQGQQLTINTRYMVGAVHYTPGVGEQWYVQQVGTVQWALNRKLPFQTDDLANVADNPVAGQVQIGSSGTVSGPLTLIGSTINAQAPISLLGASTAALPAASTAGAGALAYNTTTNQPVISDGTAWNPLVASSSSSSGSGTTVTWSEISGVPTTFPSDWSEITGIPANFPTTWNDITGVPDTFPPTLPTGTPTSINFWCGDGTWKVPSGVGGGSTQLVVGATPVGTINGTNTVFTLPVFTLDSTMVYLNGSRQQLGVAYVETNDTTITFATAPPEGAVLSTDYVVGEAGGAGTYSTMVGDGTSTTYVLTHNLNTRSVVIAIYDASSYEEVNCDKFRTSVNEITLIFQVAPAANAYVALVVAPGSTTISGTWVAGEIPTGSVNGVNLSFATSQPYDPGSTSVFVNGLRKEISVDYIESSGNEIVFGTAPTTGAVILVDYLTSA
jgi:hypothetical protein